MKYTFEQEGSLFSIRRSCQLIALSVLHHAIETQQDVTLWTESQTDHQAHLTHHRCNASSQQQVFYYRYL